MEPTRVLERAHGLLRRGPELVGLVGIDRVAAAREPLVEVPQGLPPIPPAQHSGHEGGL